MQRYPLKYNGRQVGEVTVDVCGLYRRILCSCTQLPGLYRLYVNTDRGDKLIGVCCPEGEQLIVRKKIANKSLGSINKFYIRTQKIDDYVVIHENEPLLCLARLPLARFLRSNGLPGLEFQVQDKGSVTE